MDYILYTDQPKINENTIWQYRNIPEKVLNMSTNGKVRNEYVRTHPHEFFAEYDYSIYVDGNLQIMSDISAWICLVNSSVGMAMHPYPLTPCIYVEAHLVITARPYLSGGIKKQLKHYRKEGFPKNIGGLMVTAVIVTDLHNKKAKEIYEAWWDDFMHWKSYRDQLSLRYILWKLNIDTKRITTLGGNTFDSPKLRRHKHTSEKYIENKI